MPALVRPAVAGLLAVAAGAATAELVAALLGRPQAGTVVAVGAVAVDAAPTPVKEFAVATLGTADKPVLLGGIALVLAVLAAALGVLGRREPRVVPVGAALLGLIGVAAALTRPASSTLDALPSAAGAVLIGAALVLLLRRVPAPVPVGAVPAGPAGPGATAVGDPGRPAVDPGAPAGGGPGPLGGDPGRPAVVDRRAFVTAAGLVALGTVAAGGTAVVLGRRGPDPRAAVRLPAPASPAPPLPPGLDPGFVTANADFYRVDTALTLPRVDLASWRLTLGGLVDRPVELSYADLLDRPLVERVVTLNCVSNEVGGPYISTSRWLGVPLVPLLREAGVQAGADQLLARSVEGMTIGTPVGALFDGREPLLCVGMNGEPLPVEHGFPVRMLTPGLYGYVGACKWVTELTLTTFAAEDAYWVARGWAPDGPVKTASRIDRPAPFEQVGSGPVTVAGVAWAQVRGISGVEVQVDDGPWESAELLPVPSVDTWVQWRLRWTPTPGGHLLRVRATDGTGAVQTEERATPFPDGATGWHSVAVTAG